MKFITPTPITDALLISSSVAENDYSAWSATTWYATGGHCILAATHRRYELISGRSATVTMTIAAPGVVTWTAHGLATDTPIIFTTSGALPTGLVVGTTYYAKVVTADTFQIAATAGGVAITTSGTQSGTHTCGLAAAYGKQPDLYPDYWLDIGPTNRWSMFDASVGSLTSGATPLSVTLAPGIVNSLALLDLSATSVSVTMTDGLGGPTVYDRTITLGDGADLTSWYDFFFEPLQPQTTAILTDLPPYSSGRITIAIAAATTAECGTCVVGTLVELGRTLTAPQISIQDYSRKEADTFGVVSFIERSYARKVAARFLLENKYLDYAARKLAAVRATPVIWIADDNAVYESLLLYGIYRDWGIDIAYAQYAEASITLESLT